VLIVDIKQDCKQWNLFYENESFWESCDSCRKFLKLTQKCECGKVNYCSDACQ